MARPGSLGARLYRGEMSWNIVGNRRRWYVASAVILLLAIVGLLTRGLNLGIEFKGGAEFSVPRAACSVTDVRQAVESQNVGQVLVTETGNSQIRVQTPALETETSNAVIGALADTCQVSRGDVKVQIVGPSWGGEITKKALMALLVFLIAVSVFLSIYFEWRMALAAFVALVHDMVITIGIYALIGFEVTPATVIGFLTILGYSLYDTVVVFDKVKENTRGIAGQSRRTYSEAANLALNQTLVRSLNTSLTTLLPIASILFIGAMLLGAGTLQDLALALFVGTAAGTYSSVFVATPFLCDIKERQPEMKAVARRAAARRAGLERQAAGVGEESVTAVATAASGSVRTSAPAAEVRVERRHRQTGQRNQPKRAPRSKR